MDDIRLGQIMLVALLSRAGGAASVTLEEFGQITDDLPDGTTINFSMDDDKLTVSFGQRTAPLTLEDVLVAVFGARNVHFIDMSEIDVEDAG